MAPVLAAVVQQVCVQPPTSAVNVTLLALATGRRAAGRPVAAAVDRYLLPAPHGTQQQTRRAQTVYVSALMSKSRYC